MNRAGSHALANRHAGSVAHSGRERQRTLPALPKRARVQRMEADVKQNQTESGLGKSWDEDCARMIKAIYAILDPMVCAWRMHHDIGPRGLNGKS